MLRKLGGFLAFTSVAFTASVASAQEAAKGILHPGDGGWIAIAVAIGIGIAVFGGAFGQGRTAAAALEGISRNPGAADKVFVPMILGLAFIESLVLFNWVLMLMMLLKM
jgi:F-type H+-transporting ATPase subunit c